MAQPSEIFGELATEEAREYCNDVCEEDVTCATVDDIVAWRGMYTVVSRLPFEEASNEV